MTLTTIKLYIEPDVIKLKQEDTEIKDLQLRFKLSGIGSYTLNEIHVVVLDEEGERIYELDPPKQLNKRIPVIPMGHTESLDPISLDFLNEDMHEEVYDKLKSKTYKMVISITGTKEIVSEADIIFE